MNPVTLSPSLQNNLINDYSTPQTLLGPPQCKAWHCAALRGQKDQEEIRCFPSKSSQTRVKAQRFPVCPDVSDAIYSFFFF